MAVLLSGCCEFCYKDVVYEFDIPQSDADCPAGMEVRSGGGGVIDRSGGGGVIDRNGDQVTNYCANPCPPGEVPVGDPGIDWNSGEDVVVAEQQCAPSP